MWKVKVTDVTNLGVFGVCEDKECRVDVEMLPRKPEVGETVEGWRTGNTIYAENFVIA